jgi:hypothetical protein
MRGANLKVILILPVGGRLRPRRPERSFLITASQKYAAHYGYC